MFFPSISDKKILKHYLSIDDLKNEMIKKRTDLIKNREKIRICVLDNDGFDSQQLKKIGYKNIDVRESFDNINDFSDYNVILCDVDGIGANFNPKKQGIAIAEQIYQSYYPNIQIAIYTGKELNNYEYKEIDGVKVIKKNIPSSVLTNEIDDICSIFWDPIKAWKSLEKHFHNKGLPNKEIAILEDIFVRSSLSGGENYYLKRSKILENTKFKEILETITGLTLFVLKNLK